MHHNIPLDFFLGFICLLCPLICFFKRDQLWCSSIVALGHQKLLLGPSTAVHSSLLLVEEYLNSSIIIAVSTRSQLLV